MEKRRKKLRERVGLKVFAAITAIVCVFVCFVSLVLTVICLKTDVYFEDDPSTLIENVTEEITDVEMMRFEWALQRPLLKYSDDGVTLDPECIEPYTERFMPENCNFIFLVTDEDGRNVYCTADYNGTGEIAGYHKTDYTRTFEANVLTNIYEQITLRYDDMSSAMDSMNDLVYYYGFRGELYGLMSKTYGNYEFVPIMAVSDNGIVNRTAYYDTFAAAYNYYSGEERHYSGYEPVDRVETDPAATIIPSSNGDIPIFYLEGKILATKSVYLEISAYLSADPQVIDSVYYGTMIAEIIAKNPKAYPIVFICAAAVFLVCIIYLCCSAGYRYPNDLPSPMWFDKIPFELFLIAGGFAAYFTIFAYVELVYDRGYLAVYNTRLLSIGMLLLIPVFVGIFAVLTLMTIATRLKTSTFWKYTVVGFIVCLIIRILRLIWVLLTNIRLTWKVIAMMIVFFIYNLLSIAAALEVRAEELYALLFFVGNVALTAILLLWAIGFTRIRDYAKKVANGELNSTINRDFLFGDLKRTADDLEGVGEGVRKAVDERMRSERLKTELITNVSHDLKTPLTSIVNYVDILSKDDIESETAREHIDVLKRQAARMKKLIEDLVEVSKATSGNVSVNMERTDVNLLLTQTETEYASKFEEYKLEPMVRIPERKMIANLDGRLMWRVLDNLCNNICKYAMPHTRVYITAEDQGTWVRLSFKNISRYPLDITGEDLMERFVRGDSSRNTEGSGLGLSIAKSLCDLQGVGFAISVDGDLFKAELTIQKIGDEELFRDEPTEEMIYDRAPSPEIREGLAEGMPEDNENTQTDLSSTAEEVPPEGENPKCSESTNTD